MLAILNRSIYTEAYTLGYMLIGGEVFRTLELPWRDNATGVSCIPEGTYNCNYLHRSTSGKYNRVYHVHDDPKPRIGILFHTGNLPRHTRGCILVGTKHGWLGGQRAVLGSGSAFAKMRRAVGRNGFKLIITSPKRVVHYDTRNNTHFDS